MFHTLTFWCMYPITLYIADYKPIRVRHQSSDTSYFRTKCLEGQRPKPYQNDIGIYQVRTILCRQKHVSCVTTGNKVQITVVAACYAIPPMVIFDRKILKPEMTVGEVPGTMYGLSSSGWMDGDLFRIWFTHHFLAHAPPARPLMLLLDGHSSHYHPETIRCAAEEQVILFCLPPHTIHLTQPLDKGCFGHLKHTGRKNVIIIWQIIVAWL